MRPQVDVGIAQQRKDRVIERRRRDLDLPSRRGVTVFRDDAPQQLELHRPQRHLVFFREAPPLGGQCPDALVAFEVIRIDPCQLVPDLQIANILD